MPLAQYVTAPVEGIETPVVREGDRYRPEDDPLQRVPVAQGDARVMFYYCDQIGTPLMMTDEAGEVVWEAVYKAWGETREVIERASAASGGAVARNALRFQGQQVDDETGLHYNRHRYYDPSSGRFVSKDPIGLLGGINSYQYANNTTGWIDPFGLARCPCDCLKKGNPEGEGPYRGGSKGGVSRPSIEGHHMPADAVTKSQDGYVGYRDGPAIAMDPTDHAATSSYKNSAAAQQYRDKLSTMIASGNYRGAMATEILDVRRVACSAGDPTKYNEAMGEMLSYAKCKGMLKK